MDNTNNKQQLNNAILPPKKYVWDIEKIMKSAERLREAAKREKEWEKKHLNIQQAH